MPTEQCGRRDALGDDVRGNGRLHQRLALRAALFKADSFSFRKQWERNRRGGGGDTSDHAVTAHRPVLAR